MNVFPRGIARFSVAFSGIRARLIWSLCLCPRLYTPFRSSCVFVSFEFSCTDRMGRKINHVLQGLGPFIPTGFAQTSVLAGALHSRALSKPLFWRVICTLAGFAQTSVLAGALHSRALPKPLFWRVICTLAGIAQTPFCLFPNSYVQTHDVIPLVLTLALFPFSDFYPFFRSTLDLLSVSEYIRAHP